MGYADFRASGSEGPKAPRQGGLNNIEHHSVVGATSYWTVFSGCGRICSPNLFELKATVTVCFSARLEVKLTTFGVIFRRMASAACFSALEDCAQYSLASLIRRARNATPKSAAEQLHSPESIGGLPPVELQRQFGEMINAVLMSPRNRATPQLLGISAPNVWRSAQLVRQRVSQQFRVNPFFFWQWLAENERCGMTLPVLPKVTKYCEGNQDRRLS